MADLKRMLELLEEDVELRYAVAEKLGVLEVLKRMDEIERNIERLQQEIRKSKGEELEKE